MSGKGSRPRPFSVSQQEFDQSWDAIFGKKDPQPIKCGCGRSPTGICTGLHALSDDEYDRYIMDGHVYPGEEPKKENKDES